jgi:putative addiction module killer protein
LDILRTDEFDHWLDKLRDRQGRANIIKRIARLEDGNFGDHKFFDGIGELRIHVGPGYRVYFARIGDTVVILLCAGDKSSQRRDVKRALEMAKEVQDGDHD